MALTSVFYDGPVTETDRATNRAGAADYGVIGADDFRVSTHPSIPYALNVAAGKAHGYGVSDTATATQVVQCATLASGTRFDLIVVRRNWQPLLGGPSTLVAIQGGSTIPNIQTIRTIGPGVEDDQPLALVEWRGSVNTPYRIIDLRCWAGNGGMIAADALALDYLARPGADVLIGSTAWRYNLGANGVWGWDKDSLIQQERLAPSAAPSGWRFDGDILIESFGSGKKITVAINVVRTGANLSIAASQSYLRIGTPIPAAARGSVGGISQTGEVSGGGPMAYNVQTYLSPVNGQILWRRASSFTFVKNAQFSFNVAYYIQ